MKIINKFILFLIVFYAQLFSQNKSDFLGEWFGENTLGTQQVSLIISEEGGDIKVITKWKDLDGQFKSIQWESFGVVSIKKNKMKFKIDKGSLLKSKFKIKKEDGKWVCKYFSPFFPQPSKSSSYDHSQVIYMIDSY